jgi:capsular exopolysaccharide synthesis family protein
MPLLEQPPPSILPVLLPGPSAALPAQGYYTPSSAPPDQEPEAPAVPWTHYLWIIRRQMWRIAAFVGICVLATFVVSSRLVPIYEATSMVDVDRQAPSGVVGQESSRMVALSDADQFLATQIKLIQSDAVLRPVAQKYGLLQHENQLRNLDPDKAQRTGRAPVLLKRLKVTRPPNTYLLLINYRSPDPQLAADVANAVAQSYLEHTYKIRINSSASLAAFMEKQTDELRAKMERSSQALGQFERELNVINPEEKTTILSSRLLQLNIEHTSAQADRVRKEAAWKLMRGGSLEAVQVSSQSEALAKLNERLNEAKERLAQVNTTFGAKHPEYRKAATAVTELENQFESTRANIANRIDAEYRQALDREQMLAKSVSDAKAESDRLNVRSFQYKQLRQEAEGDKKLYEELIRKIREAGINAGFQNNNVRIADMALPPAKPVYPNLTMNLVLALLFSSILAIGAAVLSDAADTTLRDPEQASRFLGTDVIGVLPAVRRVSDLNPLMIAEPSAASLAGAEKAAGKNGYHSRKYYRTIGGFREAIRTLRNTILLDEFGASKHSILVTSAGPGEGKSTAAVHLAIAHAEHGKKTLLVDGDLRRPTVHKRLGLNPQFGFSAVLAGEVEWQDAVLPLEGQPNLFVLAAGTPSHRASDLVGPRIAGLLDEWTQHYDLVVLDSPPLLGFAEPLLMARVAGGVLVVGRVGETRRQAVASVLTALHRVRARVLGIVMNQLKGDSSSYGYSYYGYYYHRPSYYTADEN